MTVVEILGSIVCIIMLWICAYVCITVVEFFDETPKQLKRIADKMELRESNYSKGYDDGYADAMRAYGITKDGDT